MCTINLTVNAQYVGDKVLSLANGHVDIPVSLGGTVSVPFKLCVTEYQDSTFSEPRIWLNTEHQYAKKNDDPEAKKEYAKSWRSPWIDKALTAALETVLDAGKLYDLVIKHDDKDRLELDKDLNIVKRQENKVLAEIAKKAKLAAEARKTVNQAVAEKGANAKTVLSALQKQAAEAKKGEKKD